MSILPILFRKRYLDFQHLFTMNFDYFTTVSKHDKPKEFLSVRLYGNKTSYAKLIFKIIMSLEPRRFLDAFGGTGVVSYLLSDFCKVTYIDLLEFCCTWMRALVNGVNISWKKLEALTNITPVRGMISEEFREMYFEDWENGWLDGFMAEAWKLRQPERDIAIASISQACIAKRPFGAFHRANLYFRRSKRKRSFNNWRTWNKEFKELYIRFLNEIRNARKNCNIRVIRDDCFSCDKDTDVIYADPPFVGKDYHIDYLKLYHFVEGLARWDEWENLIDWKNRLKCLYRKEYPEFKRSNAEKMLKQFFKTCECEAIVFSWAIDGYPEPAWIMRELRKRWKELLVIGVEKPVYLRGRRIELLLVAGDKVRSKIYLDGKLNWDDGI